MDYGLRQYVSAIEFKAGPLSNPHLPRIETGVAQIKVLEVVAAGPPTVVEFENFKGVLPKGELPTNYFYSYINLANGDVGTIVYQSSTEETQVSVVHGGTAPVAGNIIEITGITSSTEYPQTIQDGCLNATWNYPFCPGGLRYGDTIWMNMHYTNPHAIEGLFAKSRGVLNEHDVWNGFNGGKG